MTKRQLLLRIISFSILLVAVFSVTLHPAPLTDIITYLQNTTAWWLIIVLILFVFWLYNYYFFKKRDIQNMKVVQWYLLWIIICIFRGLFIAQTYWDWKGLIGNTFGLLVPIVAYTATNKVILQSILSFYVKYTLPLFVIFAFIISTDAYGFYLVPISFLMLFFPVLPTPWKWVVAAITLLVLTIDLGARSNVIKFGLPVFFMLIYYSRARISVKLFEFVRKLLIIIPFILFLMAISGVFNVYNMDQYIKGNYKAPERDSKGQIVEDNLKNDTRTFLYIEVLQTAKIYNSWLIGRSPARGNISESFGEEDENNRGERLGNEVAILNVFTWTGIVGVVLYLFIFYRASYIAINQSNNVFSKMIGLYIAFRWLYAWVEDINYFTLTTVFLWLTIGLCFSKSFRSMSNNEVKYWVRGIFNVYNKELYRRKVLENQREKYTDRRTHFKPQP